jgi:hypothetical protein
MNVGSVEDRLAIRELVERFTVGIMRLDPEIWIEVWAEEGVWKLPSMTEPARGKAALRAAFHKSTDYLTFMSMLFFPSGLVVDGDRARGQAYGQEIIVPKEGDAKFLTGCFEDEYVKRDGRWLFLSRDFSVLGIDALRR